MQDKFSICLQSALDHAVNQHNAEETQDLTLSDEVKSQIVDQLLLASSKLKSNMPVQDRVKGKDYTSYLHLLSTMFTMLGKLLSPDEGAMTSSCYEELMQKVAEALKEHEESMGEEIGKG